MFNSVLDTGTTPDTSAPRPSAGPHQGGYTLVALLALMTILAITMTAAAPILQQQAKREREKESIRRGEEVAEAIRQFVRAKNVLPKSMDELLEGVTPPGRINKVQILRASAARDPLSSSGEWLLIKPTDSRLIEFQRDVALYAGGRPVPTNDPMLSRFFNVRITSVVDLGTKEEAPGGEDDSTNIDVEFIGVASRSRRASVMTYYDIERHDKWIFTPLFR